MWIQIRSMLDGKTVRIDNLSKLTKTEELREKLVDHFDVPIENQRLFYRGKQFVDGHTLFDYNVGLNEIVQLMIRAPVQPESAPTQHSPEAKAETQTDKSEEDAEPSCSQELDSIFKLGDVIDARDETMGCWFEATIQKITKRVAKSDAEPSETTDTDKADTDKEGDKGGADKMDVEREPQPDATGDDDKENQAADINANVGSDVNANQDKAGAETKALVAAGQVKAACDSDSGGNVTAPSVGKDDDCVYHVQYIGYETEGTFELKSSQIRPRSRTKLAFNDLQVGSEVMVNYNYDEPECRGYWYDAVVTDKRNTRTIKELYCTVFIGKDLVPMEKCQVLFRDDVFAIEKAGSQLNINDDPNCASTDKRECKPECDHCQDKPKRKCKFCACHTCGGKDDPEKQIMCDECDMAYHLYCLDPPLDSVPEADDWYCHLCKNDDKEVVRAGEKLKESKKKSKMASATGNSGRDWGKGMACVGRSKMCNIVPPNHFGPIPGVEVGQMWKFRVGASEAGVHRPHVAGIHGREDEGSYSIVLSGGYEDDVDDGDQFTYTGSGGRDLSGNKRTAEQSCDQTLTRMNRALAKNCNAPLDNKKGAEAKDWKAGKPVRVIRNCKGRKHSKFAPEEGNRYDGIYKMVKYWPAKGKSGHLVWRYMLRRDDPIPAPWTKEGSQRIEQLGLAMEYPEGWLEKEQAKEADGTPGTEKKKKRKNKRPPRPLCV